MSSECADLWVFENSENVLYAVHGCIDNGSGSWCYNTLFEKILCPSSYNAGVPGCTDGPFRFDNLNVNGCISVLNLQLDSQEQLDINAAKQILDRTSPNFPKCSSGNQLTLCPAPIERAQLLPGPTLTNSTSTHAATINNSSSTATFSANANNIEVINIVSTYTSTSSPQPIKVQQFGQTSGSGSPGLTVPTIVAISIVSAFAFSILVFLFYMFRRQRMVHKKRARRFEDVGDDEEMFEKWKKSLTFTEQERSTFLPNPQGSGWPSSPPELPSETVDPNIFQGKRYVALHAYTKEHDDEMDVEEGEMLQVDKYYPDDPPISLQEDTRTPYISPTHYSAPGSIRSGRKPEGLRFVPTPMYRSRIMELNRLLASSYESRKSTYNAVAGTMLIVAFLLALFSMLVATRGYYWVTIIVFVVIGVSVSSFKPLLESVFFTKPLASVQNQARQLMHEWNSRSPPHLRFRIVGGGLILEDLNRIIGLDPELHVIFLDEPVRPLVLRSHSRSTTPAGSYGSTYVGQEEELGEEHEDGTVFVVPDETRDGLMMTVKIVSKPSREKINFDDERIYGQFGRSSNNSPENPD
ncbi:hypothetical protein HK098_005109 [Nowakowskiella sp. JEL0407]|nr:hypothetical protein HK098_005109 [Nowakowskiella sp. JEL0407]